MQPDLDLDMLFPDRQARDRMSERELSVFADFWDDESSDEENLGAIAWWLERGGDGAQNAR